MQTATQPVEENSETQGGVFFTETEWKYFKLEIEDMLQSDRKFSLEKAVHNARYLAELDRRLENVKAGKNCVTFTEEEWEAFVNAQNI